MVTYTKQDILNSLDDCRTYNFFLDLESGYFSTAGSRISLFADDARWAVVFETNGYGNRSGRGEIVLNYFGNCLINLDKAGMDGMFVCNSKYFTLIDSDDFEKIEEDYELISKDATTVNIRGVDVEIEQDREKYASIGIEIQDFNNPQNLIDFPSLIRYIHETNSGVLRATSEELRTCIPNDLPLLLKIDDFHHRSYSEYGGDKPSSYETYQLIAHVLVSKDIQKWKPTLEPTNNWRNWPEAGGL